MLLVTASAVEERLARPLTPEEAARFDVVARDVTALLRSVAPRIPDSDPVPDAVAWVAGELAIARLAAPPGAGGGEVQQESLGGYSVTYRSTGSAGPGGLTEGHLAALAPWRRPRIAAVAVDPGGAVVGR